MKRLLLSTALPIVVGALYFGPLQSADAAPTSYSVTVTFGETYGPAQGGAGITDDLAQPYTFSLAGVGSAVGPVAMALWSPHGNCTGGGCSGVTETDPISANFTFTSPSATTPTTITVNGMFYAKYSGAHLACDTTGGSQSDCVIWTGSTTNTGAGYLDVPISFTDGAALSMRIYNAQDWDITNYVSFTETAVPTAAAREPATIALLGLGLLGTIAVARRQTR